jgi:hypothetical protein
MKCDICGFAWASVHMEYHNETPVMLVCADCINVGYSIHEMVYADGSEWYVEEDMSGEIISGMFPNKHEAHSFIGRILRNEVHE